MRVLLVEDDTILAQAIINMLSHNNYQTEHCTTGSQAMQALQHCVFDLLILDLGLPDGFAGRIVQQLRSEKHQLPVLVLTALNKIETKLQMLNDGADDYMLKPFDMRELEARLRVLLRRKLERTNDILKHGDLLLDLVKQSCEYAQESINLTRREFLLLKSFLHNKGKALSREYLEELCNGWNGDIESNAVEVHIHNLRKKLYPELIITVRGFGYLLQE